MPEPRKAVLRYHQPTSSTSSTSSYTYGDLNAALNGPVKSKRITAHQPPGSEI
jgi:hypothetical protein